MNRTHILLLAGLVLGAAPSTPADTVADSLAVAVRAGEVPPGERLQFLKSEFERNLTDDPRLALSIARRMVALAADTGTDSVLSRAHLDNGIALYFLGDYRNALRRYEDALAIALNIADAELEGDAVTNIGILYFVWGEHDTALEYYLKALDLRLRTGDKRGAASCYNNIAGVHQTAGDYAKAEGEYRQALDLYREIGDRVYAAGTLSNIGLLLHEQGRDDPAIAPLEEALAMQRELADRSGEALTLNSLGEVRMAQGRFDDARTLLEQALAIRRETGDRQGASVSLQSLGKSHVAAGNAAAGIPMLTEALALARELEVPELIRDDLLALAEVREAQGRHDLALALYREYKETNDRIFDAERSRQMAAAEAKFEVDLKDREIAGLRQAAAFEAFRQRIMWIGTGLLALIIVLLWNRYRFQKRANTAINEKSLALAVAHADLENAAREQLVHVARVATMGELTAAFAHELHQPLAAIKANARAARNLLGRVEGGGEVEAALLDIGEDAGRAREIIKRLREMMRKGEVRREEHDLGDIVRTAVGFVAAQAAGHEVSIRLDRGDGDLRISCDHIQLQQVVLNLLQNAIAAMAGSGEITVRIGADGEGMVQALVSDAGPPVSDDVLAEMFEPFFTTKDHGLGMGLPICKTIIEAHGGVLFAERNQGPGLTVGFRVPIAH